MAVAAQLVNPSLETVPGAEGFIVKDHEKGFSLKVFMRNPCGILAFQLDAQIHDRFDFVAGEIPLGNIISTFQR